MTVELPLMPLMFYCIYSGQNADLDLSEPTALTSEEPTLIGGDFNVHHEMWGSTRRNHLGRHLAANLAEAPGVSLLNTGELTHTAGGVLDLSSMSRMLNVDTAWALHPHLASDHFATVVGLPVPPPEDLPLQPCWNLCKVNWGKFRRCTATHLASIPRPNNLHAAEERLVNMLRSSANKTIPFTCPTPRSYRDRWYYTAEVREASHQVNMAHKLCHCHNTKAMCGLLRAAIRQAKATASRVKEEHWLA